MGATEEGAAWCTKALHPSDPVSECAGIPDESAVPSAHMNFMSTFQFKAPAGIAASDTWGFDLDVLPHPVAFGAVQTFDSAVTLSELVALNNTQLTGANHSAKYATWVGYAQRWRPTYMGVTLYQDGAALTNQGTLQACQRPVHSVRLNGLAGQYAPGTLSGGRLALDTITYQSGDRTSFETVSNMPNAYIGKSSEGCYMPIIMTQTCQKWHGQHDQVQFLGITTPDASGYAVPTASASQKWPFYDVAQIYQSGSAASTVVCGNTISKPGSDIWGLICARNLDPSTSFTVVFRAGWEIQCQPGTLLSPQLHISPPYDPQALATYFAIRRELKDAYPAAFNDWGKIWGVIKKAASVVLPGVSMMGPIGAGIAGAGGAAISVVDAITKAVSKSSPTETGRNPMPLAEKERAQEINRAAGMLIRQPRVRISAGRQKKPVKFPKQKKK